jgi:hypothetical protein
MKPWKRPDNIRAFFIELMFRNAAKTHPLPQVVLTLVASPPSENFPPSYTDDRPDQNIHH